MSNESPLVTVYIPCRNYGRFLRQSVESVFNQLYTSWELFIVDEGSEDDSLQIAHTLKEKHPDRVMVIQNPKPIGLQRIANEIMLQAQGKYMMRLDADDWLDEVALLALVMRLERSPDVGLVYGNYFYASESGKVLGVERQESVDFRDGRSKVIPPHGACTLFRLRSLKAVGGYSTDISAQDGWELWHKIVDRVGAVSITTPVFYYRQHSVSLSTDSSRLLQARSKIFSRLAGKLEGDYKVKTLVVIPVKEHYPSFRDIPYRKIKGRSLLEIAITEAAKSRNVTDVVVASSSPGVLKYAEELETSGVVPPHTRILRKASSESGLQVREIMLEVGEEFANEVGYTPDIVAFLSMHAVNRCAHHIENALDVLRVSEADSVVSVQEEREPVFVYSAADSLELINPGRFKGLQFENERLFRFNGSIVATWWDVLNDHHLFGDQISFIEMSEVDSIQIKSESIFRSQENL